MFESYVLLPVGALPDTERTIPLQRTLEHMIGGLPFFRETAYYAVCVFLFSVLLCYQTVDESRGMIGMDHAGILPYFDGIAIHDCWRPYWRYGNLGGHGVCCAHLLRECKGLHEMHPQSLFFRFFPWLLRAMLETKKKRMAKGKEDAGKYFEMRQLVVFGRQYSFGLYLVHAPIICSLGGAVLLHFLRRGYDYGFGWSMAALMILITSFLCSWFVYRFVDVPSTRLAKWLEQRYMAY